MALAVKSDSRALRTLARREVRVVGLPEPVSHYTDVVVANGFAFISGMVALDGDGHVVGANDVLGQTRQALTHLGACLAAVGATSADICKVTVFVVNMGDRAQINIARREFFGASRPASTLVQVASLILPELLVEIEAIAVIPAGAGSRDLP